MKKSISIGKLISFNLKLFVKDVSITLLSGIILLLSLVFSIIFAIFKSKSDSIVVYYNYFFLITFGVVAFLLILRMVTLILTVKMEDKTIYMLLTSNIARWRLVWSLIFATILSLLVVQIASFILINSMVFFVGFKINYVLLRLTTVNLIYALFYGVFLVNFFIFLSLVMKPQLLLSLCSILLACNFISSLPYQFLTTKEENENLTMDRYSIKLTDLYNAFDFEEAVNGGRIKYPDLTKYINEFLIHGAGSGGGFINGSGSNQYKNNTELRYTNLWKELGLAYDVDTDAEDGKYQVRNIQIKTAPNQYNFAQGDKVNLSVNLKRQFITTDKLDDLIYSSTDATKLKVLTEFRQFMKTIISLYGGYQGFQKHFYNKYTELIFLADGDKSTVSKADSTLRSAGDPETLSSSQLSEIYQNTLVPGIQEGLSVEPTSDSKDTDDYSLHHFIYDQDGGIFRPTMICARILENYMILLTSHYTVATSNPMLFDTVWNDYEEKRDLYNGFLFGNVFANNIMNFTYFAGKSYNDIWFDPNSDSSITFSAQNNLFLTYPTYKFKLDENRYITKDSYNNYVKPYFFLAAQFVIGFINLVVALSVFNRKDIN